MLAYCSTIVVLTDLGKYDWAGTMLIKIDVNNANG